MTLHSFDNIPIWIIYLSFLIVFFLFVEFGYFLGRKRGRADKEVAESRKIQAGTVLATLFALVTFLLAFTFDMAGSQYNTRRNLVLQHANAIGTTYLRAEQMPEPHRTNIRKYLREYAILRIYIDEENTKEVLSRTVELEKQIWHEATLITQKLSSPTVSIFVQSLNKMIELHFERLNFVLWIRIPIMLVLTLAFLTAISLVLYGYLIGLAGQRQDITRSLIIIAFTTVFMLVIDLDRPLGGNFQLNHQPMIELYKSLEN